MLAIRAHVAYDNIGNTKASGNTYPAMVLAIRAHVALLLHMKHKYTSNVSCDKCDDEKKLRQMYVSAISAHISNHHQHALRCLSTGICFRLTVVGHLVSFGISHFAQCVINFLTI